MNSVFKIKYQILKCQLRLTSGSPPPDIFSDITLKISPQMAVAALCFKDQCFYWHHWQWQNSIILSSSLIYRCLSTEKKVKKQMLINFISLIR